MSPGQLPAVLSSLTERLPHCVLLSTCNRTEVYTLDQEGQSHREAVVDFMSLRAEVSRMELRPHLYLHEGKAAVEHLFRVASGLDSMIIGEHEILGQVRQAQEKAEETGSAGLVLSNLFRHAVRTGRRVRHQTQLSRSALSVSSVAVDLVTKVVGELNNRCLLVVGAGEAGRLVAKAAQARKASQITVTSRSEERAAALADVLGGRSVPMSELAEALRQADVVVTCTGAAGMILGRQLIETAMSSRPDRPMAVVDIAVPRDVDPEVRKIRNVSLYDIDDLTQIAQKNEHLRRTEVHKAMKIVDTEVARFTAWLEALRVKPTVIALVQKAEAIRRAQLAVTFKKLRGLSDEERQVLDSMTRAIVKHLLHDPIQCLKRNCSGNDLHIQVVSELFRLGSGVSS